MKKNKLIADVLMAAVLLAGLVLPIPAARAEVMTDGMEIIDQRVVDSASTGASFFAANGGNAVLSLLGSEYFLTLTGPSNPYLHVGAANGQANVVGFEWLRLRLKTEGSFTNSAVFGNNYYLLDTYVYTDLAGNVVSQGSSYLIPVPADFDGYLYLSLTEWTWQGGGRGTRIPSDASVVTYNNLSFDPTAVPVLNISLPAAGTTKVNFGTTALLRRENRVPAGFTVVADCDSLTETALASSVTTNYCIPQSDECLAEADLFVNGSDQAIRVTNQGHNFTITKFTGVASVGVPTNPVAVGFRVRTGRIGVTIIQCQAPEAQSVSQSAWLYDADGRLVAGGPSSSTLSIRIPANFTGYYVYVPADGNMNKDIFSTLVVWQVADAPGGYIAYDNFGYFTAHPVRDFVYIGDQCSVPQNGVFDLRFVGGLDTLSAYHEIGFIVLGYDGEIDDTPEREYKIGGEIVYDVINARVDGTMTAITAASVGRGYLFALTIENIPAAGVKNFVVVPYAVCADREIRFAEACTICYNNGAYVSSTVTAIPTRVRPAYGSASTIYLDGLNGNDARDGLTAATAVRTMERAQQLVRANNRDMTADLVVRLTGNCTYILNQTLRFDASDGGTNGYRVRWFNPDAPQLAVVSGCTPVYNWTLHDAAKNIWVADVPAGVASRDLFVNGAHYRIAQMEIQPNSVQICSTGFTTTDMRLRGLARSQDLDVRILNYWTCSYLNALGITDHGTCLGVTMVDPGWTSWYNTASCGGGNADASMIQTVMNAYEFLDEAGEWYLNPATHKIYAIPMSGVNLNGVVTALGRLETLMAFDGEVDAFVSDIAFEGLTFAHTTWNQPDKPEGYLEIQAGTYKAAGVNATTCWDNANWLDPVGAVMGEYTDGLVFADCIFTNLGSDALSLGSATKNATITRNIFSDIGGNAVSLGGFSFPDHDLLPQGATGTTVKLAKRHLSENNSVTYNAINNAASVYWGSVGIRVGYTARTDVSHNTLTNLPYSAISFGWGWGFGGAEIAGTIYLEDGMALFRDNTITYNRIENIMLKLFDGGGIYTLGRNDNSFIQNNYIANVANDYGGIYLDNGSMGFTVTNNALVSCHRNYIYKGDYNYLHDNYAKTAPANDLEMWEPAVPGVVHGSFTNNYLWNDSAVAAIRAASGCGN